MKFTVHRPATVVLPDSEADKETLRAAMFADVGVEPAGNTTTALLEWVLRLNATDGVGFLPVPVLVEEDDLTWSAETGPEVRFAANHCAGAVETPSADRSALSDISDALQDACAAPGDTLTRIEAILSGWSAGATPAEEDTDVVCTSHRLHVTRGETAGDLVHRGGNGAKYCMSQRFKIRREHVTGRDDVLRILGGTGG